MLTRAWPVVVAVLTALTLAPAQAQARAGPGGCASSGTHGRCWVEATDPARPGGPATPPSSSGSPTHPQAGVPQYPCVKQAWTPPPAGDPLWGGHNPSQGSLTFLLCQGGGSPLAWPRIVFTPNGLPVAVPQVSPAQLAQQVISEMGLSAPDIRLAPPADSAHGATVGFPVWMWTTRSEATTGPVIRTATAGAITVTVTADLADITWSMGDGATVDCPGPGTAFTDDQAGQASPDCGHIYQHTASTGTFSIAATSRWRITWSGGGETQSQAMALTAHADLPVREIRTLNIQ